MLIYGGQSNRGLWITWFHEYKHLCRVDAQTAGLRARGIQGLLDGREFDDCAANERWATNIVDVAAAMWRLATTMTGGVTVNPFE